MIKILNILIFLIVMNLFSYSQNQDLGEFNNEITFAPNPSYSSFTMASWTTLASTPHAVSRSCCALVSINGTDYLYQFGGGNSNSELKRVARLNLSTNTWTNNYSTMPYSISSGTAIPMRGDSFIYVFGGNNPTLGKTLRYNVYSNSWQTMQDMQTRVTDAFVVKYSDTRIFIIGGGNGYFGVSAFRTNKVQVYNINTNSYTTVNNYPINCSMLGGGIYRDTVIGVGGYTNGGNATANCYKGVINPSTFNITWTSIASYPLGPILRFASYIAFKDDGVGVMCTGGAVNGSNPTAQTFFYNFCTKSWQNNLPNNSVARSNFKAAGRGNINYVVAGFTNTGIGTTEKLDFSFIDGTCFNMLGFNNSNNSVPEDYYIKQNYPNPFNPSTIIKFGIPKQNHVKLIIYDEIGREVETLVNETMKPGKYEAAFDGTNYASGVYFFRIETGQFVSSKTMLLVK